MPKVIGAPGARSFGRTWGHGFDGLPRIFLFFLQSKRLIEERKSSLRDIGHVLTGWVGFSTGVMKNKFRVQWDTGLFCLSPVRSAHSSPQSTQSKRFFANILTRLTGSPGLFFIFLQSKKLIEERKSSLREDETMVLNVNTFSTGVILLPGMKNSVISVSSARDIL